MSEGPLNREMVLGRNPAGGIDPFTTLALFGQAAVVCMGICLMAMGMYMGVSVFRLVTRMVNDPETVAAQLERWGKAFADAPGEEAPMAPPAPNVVPVNPPGVPGEVTDAAPAAGTRPVATVPADSVPPEKEASFPAPQEGSAGEGEGPPARLRTGERRGVQRALTTLERKDELGLEDVLKLIREGLLEGKFGTAISAILLFGFVLVLVRIPIAFMTAGSRIVLAVVQARKEYRSFSGS